MAFLSLSDDELALLRFTCDLFFVQESPLWSLDAAQREPRDYEAAYRSLVEKEVVDPHGFRVTDAALNRLAPLTECDARVVHVQKPPAGKIEQRDYFLLDDIAVQYASADGMHAIGEDKDPDELVAHLARRLVPRRSGGDRLRLLRRPERVALATGALQEQPVERQAELRQTLGVWHAVLGEIRFRHRPDDQPIATGGPRPGKGEAESGDAVTRRPRGDFRQRRRGGRRPHPRERPVGGILGMRPGGRGCRVRCDRHG